MNLAIITILLVLAAACIFGLVLDSRQRRIDSHVAKAIPRAEGGTAYRSIRREDVVSRWHLLHRVVNYKPGITYDWHPRYVVAAGFVAAITVYYGGNALGFRHLYVIPVSLITGLVIIRGLLGWQRNRLATRLLHQLPDAISLVTSTVRAGLPVHEAFRTIASKMAQPTSGQFALVCAEIELGGSPEDALDDIYRRTNVAEYGMFAVTLAIQMRSGGRLSETLQTLGDTVRQRVAMAARAKALAAEVIFSARALSVSPVLMGGLMYWINPQMLDMLFTDPTGKILLAYGISSVIVGALVIRWMIRRETAV